MLACTFREVPGVGAESDEVALPQAAQDSGELPQGELDGAHVSVGAHTGQQPADGHETATQMRILPHRMHLSFVAHAVQHERVGR